MSVITVVFIVVAAVAVAEIVVRLLAPHVATLLEWRDWECHHKAKAIDALSQQVGASVVAIGSSLTNAAFDPHQATEILGGPRPAFNAALNGATMRQLELWTRDVVLPNLRPERVLLGVYSGSLNDNNVPAARGLAMFRSAYGWRKVRPGSTFFQRAFLVGERFSYLIRYRHFLREPSSWALPPSPFDRFKKFWKNVGSRFDKARGRKAGCSDLGRLHALDMFAGPYKIGRPRMQQAWERFLAGYTVGGHEMQALGRIVDLIRSSGAQVTIVRMPVTEDWMRFHPNGRSDFERFERAVDAFAAERDVALRDLKPAFAALDEFTDALHLNEAGRKRFTALICAELFGSVDEASTR